MKVATHVVFSECCWFAASAVFDVHYGTTEVLAVAATSVLPDADYPKSWLGHQLGTISEDLNRLFGHRTFLHSLLALTLVTATLGSLLWWIAATPAATVAVLVGYGSHLLADMMTLGGVQLFWPSRLIAVFPGRDEYRVISGGNSERVFVAFALAFALLFYPVSRVGFDGLIYRMGGDDQLYGKVTKITDGDTITVETQGRTTPIRLIGVDTPETVAPDQPIGCYGKKASAYADQVLEDRLVKLEIPRVGDSEDAYGRTLAYVFLDTNKDGAYEHLFNEDLISLGLARTTTFSHAKRREFERLREVAEKRGAGLWGACPKVASYSISPEGSAAPKPSSPPGREVAIPAIGPRTHPGGGLMPPYGSLRDRRGPRAGLSQMRRRGRDSVGRGADRSAFGSAITALSETAVVVASRQCGQLRSPPPTRGPFVRQVRRRAHQDRS